MILGEGVQRSCRGDVAPPCALCENKESVSAKPVLYAWLASTNGKSAVFSKNGNDYVVYGETRVSSFYFAEKHERTTIFISNKGMPSRAGQCTHS